MSTTDQLEYPSCEWIEGGVGFNRGSLNTCLIAHHHRGMPRIAAYRGGPIPFSELVKKREEIREANRTGGHPDCAGCPHLKLREWPRHAHPLRIVGIAHYAHCNIKCSYCFLQTQDPGSFAEGLKPYSLLPVMKSLIEDGSLAPDAIIDWGGGEPTAYREFDALFDLLIAHGTFHYIHSNGVRLPEAIRRTPRPDRVHVVCSLDAGLPETYAAIKKVDALERVWRNLEEYVRLGVNVTAKYIVMSENCAPAELDAFLERVRRAGIADLIVDTDYNIANPSSEVVSGIGRLMHRARRSGLNARYGFSGDNFAPDSGIGRRVVAALDTEQLCSINAFLEARGYAYGQTIDGRVEALVTSLEAHCAERATELADKEAEIGRLAAEAARRGDELLEKEREIERLDKALDRLRRPRAIVLALLARLGLRAQLD